MANATEKPDDTAHTLADRVYQQITDAIIQGNLPPGAKISEPELARRFGVSRGPLREAIRRLQERRLVTRLPHLGARVVELSPAALSEIFVVREALEGMAAREAARQITDHEIAHLRALLKAHAAEFDASGPHRYPHHPTDEDFHFAIARCSRNDSLIGLLCGEYHQLIRLHRSQQKTILGRSRRGYMEHTRIVDALEDHDPDLAEMLMRRHVAAARILLEGSLSAPASKP